MWQSFVRGSQSSRATMLIVCRLILPDANQKWISVKWSKVYHCIETSTSQIKLAMVWESCLLEKARNGTLITCWNEASRALPVLALKSNYLEHWLNIWSNGHLETCTCIYSGRQLKPINPWVPFSLSFLSCILWSIYTLLLRANTGNFSKDSFSHSMVGSWPWPCPLIREHSILRLSDQQTLLLTENCLQCQKWSPYKGKEQFLHQFVLKRTELAQPVLTKAFLQPAKAAAMCTALCA